MFCYLVWFKWFQLFLKSVLALTLKTGNPLTWCNVLKTTNQAFYSISPLCSTNNTCSLAPNILHKNCLQFLLAYLSHAGELETRCVISNESVANKTFVAAKTETAVFFHFIYYVQEKGSSFFCYSMHDWCLPRLK